MNRDIDETINRFIARQPGPRTAYTHDPLYHAQITLMRRILTTMDLVMEDEGISEPTRQRIIRTITYGAPDETEALARLETTQKKINDLASTPFRLHLGEPR